MEKEEEEEGGGGGRRRRKKTRKRCVPNADAGKHKAREKVWTYVYCGLFREKEKGGRGRKG